MPADPAPDNALESAAGISVADAAPTREVDPAAQSLFDALKVAFSALKVAMVLLTLAYLASGVFRVGEQESAVRLQFGSLVEDADGLPKVFGPGLHFGWPEPFESRVRVPTTERTVTLDQSFWYELTEAERAMTEGELASRGRAGPLDPLKDGYLVAGDASIVHGRFSVKFRIEDVPEYVRSVGDEDRAERLVRSAVESAMVGAASRVEADELISGRVQLGDRAMLAANRSLSGDEPSEAAESVDTGLRVTGVQTELMVMPLSVREAYQRVNRAEAGRASAIDNAERDRVATLSQAGGPAAAPSGRSDGPLEALMTAYEGLADDDPLRAEVGGVLDRAFRSLRLELTAEDIERFGLSARVRPGVFEIGGEAAQTIDRARSQQTALVQGIEREAQRFEQVRASYERDAELFRIRYVEEAKREIFGPEVDFDAFQVGPNRELYLVIDSDPSVVKEREDARFAREREQAAQR
ncbi:MAG: SPFH domain-containing protein [Planctomycetota bacterium]